MNDFEKEIMNEFLKLSIEFSFEDLMKKQAIDFPMRFLINPEEMPINVYSKLWAVLRDEVSFTHDKSGPFINILRNAYYYVVFSSNNKSNELKEEIENLDIDELISLFRNDVLFGANVAKSCVNYLNLISEDLSFSDLIKEEIEQKGQNETITKLELQNIPLTEAQLLRKMLYDLYINMLKNNYSIEEIYQEIDEYFESGIVCEEIQNKYQLLFADNKIPEETLEKQRRIIYQTAFVGIQTSSYEVSNFDLVKYMVSIAPYKMELIEYDDIRQILYYIFFSYYYHFDIGMQMQELNLRDIQILQKIYPNYYLDFPSDES